MPKTVISLWIAIAVTTLFVGCGEEDKVVNEYYKPGQSTHKTLYPKSKEESARHAPLVTSPSSAHQNTEKTQFINNYYKSGQITKKTLYPKSKSSREEQPAHLLQKPEPTASQPHVSPETIKAEVIAKINNVISSIQKTDAIIQEKIAEKTAYLKQIAAKASVVKSTAIDHEPLKKQTIAKITRTTSLVKKTNSIVQNKIDEAKETASVALSSPKPDQTKELHIVTKAPVVKSAAIDRKALKKQTIAKIIRTTYLVKKTNRIVQDKIVEAMEHTGSESHITAHVPVPKPVKVPANSVVYHLPKVPATSKPVDLHDEIAKTLKAVEKAKAQAAKEIADSLKVIKVEKPVKATKDIPTVPSVADVVKAQAVAEIAKATAFAKSANAIAKAKIAEAVKRVKIAEIREGNKPVSKKVLEAAKKASAAKITKSVAVTEIAKAKSAAKIAKSVADVEKEKIKKDPVLSKQPSGTK